MWNHGGLWIPVLSVFASPSSEKLLKASRKGDLPSIQAILQNANADKKAELLLAQDEDEYTPLHLAALNGNESVVKYLVEQGADIQANDIKQSTPLHVAAGGGHGPSSTWWSTGLA